MIHKLFRLKDGIDADTIDFMDDNDFEEITDRDIQNMIDNYPVCFAAFDCIYVAVPTNLGNRYYTRLSWLIKEAVDEGLNVYGVE